MKRSRSGGMLRGADFAQKIAFHRRVAYLKSVRTLQKFIKGIRVRLRWGRIKEELTSMGLGFGAVTSEEQRTRGIYHGVRSVNGLSRGQRMIDNNQTQVDPWKQGLYLWKHGMYRED